MEEILQHQQVEEALVLKVWEELSPVPDSFCELRVQCCQVKFWGDDSLN